MENILPSVSRRLLSDKNSLPLLISSTTSGQDLSEWLTLHQEQVQHDLSCHGGILFRNFSVENTEDFNKLSGCFKTDPIPYMFRSSPRHHLSNNVYVSTTYPENRSINLHSESSYSFAWGLKIMFGCLTPPAEGGETPIADTRSVLAHISQDTVKKFEEHGVLYHRYLSPEIGLSWQEVFQTENTEMVKETCRTNNIHCEFLNNDELIIRWKRKAVWTHPVTYEKVWFNHVYFFNKYSLCAEMGLDPTDNLPDEIFPSNTYFGNGTEIPYDVYLEIKTAYDSNQVSFRWEKGDVLLLDNMLTAHGRSPYKGERLIVVSILDPYSI